MDDNVRAFIAGGWITRTISRKFIGDYIYPMFDHHLANSAYTAQEIIDAVRMEARKGGMLRGLSKKIFGSSITSTADNVLVNPCGVESFSTKT